MKKYKILTFLLILVICMTAISLTSYAAEEDHFEVRYYGYEADLRFNISFDEAGIDERQNKWLDVTATYMDYANAPETINYLFLTSTNELDENVYLYYDYDEETGWYKRHFVVCNGYGEPVSCNGKNGDTISKDDVFFLNYLISQDECEHEYKSVENKLDEYCYYDRCIWCGYENSNPHNMEESKTVESTCAAAGYKEYVCKNEGCEYVNKETIARLSHTFTSTVVKMPTCTEKGIREYSCEVCGYSYQAGINALGHNNDIFGNCKRDNCEESSKIDFSWITDTTDSVKSWWNDLWDKDDSDTNNDSDPIGKLFNNFNSSLDKLIILVFGVALVLGIITIAPLVINFFKAIFSKKNK